MKYRWTRSTMGGLRAEIVGRELEDIQKRKGALTPDIVLKDASRKTSKIHSCFEWDNTKAAHAFRLNQARYMLRSIEVVIETDDDKDETRTIELRAFQNVENEDGDKVYVTLNQARENDDYWQQVKDSAIAEIKSWQKKYKTIKEFEVIFDAIAQVT